MISIKLDCCDKALKEVTVNDERFDTAIAKYDAGKKAVATRILGNLVREGVVGVIGRVVYLIHNYDKYSGLNAFIKRCTTLTTLTDDERAFIAIAMLDENSIKVETYLEIFDLLEPAAERGNAYAINAISYVSRFTSTTEEEMLKWPTIAYESGDMFGAEIMAYNYIDLCAINGNFDLMDKATIWMKRCGDDVGGFMQYILLSCYNLLKDKPEYVERIQEVTLHSNDITCRRLTAANYASEGNKHYNPERALQLYNELIEDDKAYLSEALSDEDRFYANQVLRHDTMEVTRLEAILGK